MNYVSKNTEYFRIAKLQKRGNLKDVINYKKVTKRETTWILPTENTLRTEDFDPS